MLDAGYPLDPDLRDNPPTEVLPATLDLNRPLDILLLSHPHKDHYGLVNFLPKDLDVWCGQGARTLIQINAELFNEPLAHNIQTWEHKRPIQLGPFKITPYLTDHSAFDAFMILLEIGQKKILYSGDFRRTGRKSKLVDTMMKNPPADLDVLLMEGTTLGRNDEFPSESEIEKQLVDTFKQTKGRVFITWSSQNIDRTVSIYRACKRSQRILAVDIYSSYVLNCINSHTGSIPALGWKSIKCVVTNDRSRWFNRLGKKEFIENVCVPNGISAKKLQNNQNHWVIFIQAGLLSDFDENLVLSENDLWIYSMWKGYLSDKSSKIAGLKSWFHKAGVKMDYIHTSGHASKTDLKQFSEALNPKALIPIHSFDWDEHLDSFKNVVRLKDGEQYEI